MANNTEEGVANQRAAVAADPRAGVAADAADCSAVGSPPVRPRYSCPAAASAWAAVADAVATTRTRLTLLWLVVLWLVMDVLLLRLLLLLCWMLWSPGSCCRPSLTVLRRKVVMGFER